MQPLKVNSVLQGGKYKIEEGKISLSPSIDRFVGCKSHFFLTDGKIIWH